MKSGKYTKYIWQQADWPNWVIDYAKLSALLAQVHLVRGKLALDGLSNAIPIIKKNTRNRITQHFAPLLCGYRHASTHTTQLRCGTKSSVR